MHAVDRVVPHDFQHRRDFQFLVRGMRGAEPIRLCLARERFLRAALSLHAVEKRAGRAAAHVPIHLPHVALPPYFLQAARH
jgi:hypothetical protein